MATFAALSERGVRPLRKADEDLECHGGLRTWVRGAGQAARPRAGEATAWEKENRQLRARVKELELDREILRRAAKYFAGEACW